MLTVGRGNCESANAPAATATNPGSLSISHAIVDPQVGQNRYVIAPPESPVRTQVDTCPANVTFSAGKRACTPKALPVRFWHALQWHMDTRTGSPSQVAVSPPH